MGQSPHPITPEWPSLSACEAKLLLQINAQLLFSSDKSPMGKLLGGRILSNLRYQSEHTSRMRLLCYNTVSSCDCDVV